MKKVYFSLFVVLVVAFSSCTSFTHTMREPNVRLELSKADFTLSAQDNASATSTLIFGIDFDRLFLSKSATIEHDGASSINFAFVPVVGSYVTDKTQYYALYELMKKNPGYDFVMYPQFEKKVVCPIGIPIFKTTTVKVTAKLGKFK